MKEVTIYTDGACTGNPGPGGYAAILMFKGAEKVISGAEKETTNNRMELLAVINGLLALKEPCKVNLYSDSQYVVDAFNKNWIQDWQARGWKTSDKKDVKNRDLWIILLGLLNMHKVTFVKVKGHADNEFNNKCDKIAREEYKKFLTN